MVLKVFVICGEASGDLLASGVIKSLSEKLNGKIELYGTGGENLAKLGLVSLFDISVLSVIGFIDVIKNASIFKSLINKTANEILKIKPDIVLSVDSGGFCFRVCALAKNLLSEDDKNTITTKFYHYVAPAVWAYGKDRGKRLAKIYDTIFCLFDFERRYFTQYGLKAISVPNALYLSNINAQDYKNVLDKYYISKPIIAITLGSRMGEIKTHASIIRDILFFDKKNENIFDKYQIIFLAMPKFYGFIHDYFEGFDFKVLSKKEDKDVIIQKASFAIAKSGTNVMQFLLAEVKTIVFYKMNTINYIIGRTFIKAKFANIINIIEDKMLVPEFVQFKANKHNIYAAFKNLILGNYDKNINQAFTKAKQITNVKSTLKAPDCIADYIINDTK